MWPFSRISMHASLVHTTHPLPTLGAAAFAPAQIVAQESAASTRARNRARISGGKGSLAINIYEYLLARGRIGYNVQLSGGAPSAGRAKRAGEDLPRKWLRRFNAKLCNRFCDRPEREQNCGRGRIERERLTRIYGPSRRERARLLPLSGVTLQRRWGLRSESTRVCRTSRAAPEISPAIALMRRRGPGPTAESVTTRGKLSYRLISRRLASLEQLK